MNCEFTEIPNVEEFITHLFFNLTRKMYDVDVELIYNKLHKILIYLKRQLQNEHTQSIKIQIIHKLDKLLKLVLYTRDCYHGLNERKIAFAQLCCWYSIFPHQATDLVKLFLLDNNNNNNNKPFGSWEDVKHLCDYIKKTQPNTVYQLIEFLLTITHNETVKLFEQTIHNNNNNTNSEKLSSYHISNNIILKQTTTHTTPRTTNSTYIYSHLPHSIPSETSKYNWIFNILAEMWGEYSFNYTNKLDMTYDAIVKRANKYRMVYRKTLQLLKNQKKNQYTKITEQLIPNIDNYTDELYFIPIIDISAFSVKFNTSEKYKHIDILNYISNYASIDKILCVDNTVSVINTQNIQSIKTVPNNTYPDYNKAIDVVLRAIKEINLSNHEIEKLKIVFISNLGITESNPTIIYNYFIENFKQKLYGKPIPTIIFWNNSNENTPYFSNTNTTQQNEHYFTTDGQNIILNDNIIFASGLSTFSKYILQPYIKNTTQLIEHILNEKRYNIKYTPF